MKTLVDYLDYYNNISFKDVPFNDMDNIVFSTLVYLPLENILIDNDTLYDISKKVTYIKGVNKNSMPYKALKLLDQIVSGQRYKEISLYNLVSIVDNQTQFCAVTIRFDKNKCHVAFRGTDNSIIGWKENFDLSYMYPVPAQMEATNYLKRTIKWNDKKIYVGGHSKGGNLAMASVMETDNSIYKKIVTIYNNDGPGFLTKEFNSDKFKKMSLKLKMFLPEESIVGILLNNGDYQVVKSKERGVYQHDLTTWECFGGFLTKGRLSNYSKKTQDQILLWLDKTDNQNKRKLVETFFKIISDTGITEFKQLKQLKLSQVSSMVKDAQNIDEASKQLLLNTLMNLIGIENK